ncbi:uncharacterized protein [Ptychodera flava]|uniref:uncharacterized protein n=1 Tax=Ptychodera flava TaxID=63121 RepID=UPI003969F6B0
MALRRAVQFLFTFVCVLWQTDFIKGECSGSNGTVCAQGSTQLCLTEVCDKTAQCDDESDETTIACNWKAFLTLQTPSVVWVEQFPGVEPTSSQLRGLNLGSTAAHSPVDLTEKMTDKIYTFVGDHNEGMVFYASATSRTIKRVQYNTVPTEKILYNGTSDAVYLMAIDKVSQNIYWIDDRYKMITMAKYEGRFYKHIVRDLDKPRGLAVDPINGHIYWSDCSDGNPRIERASLAGEERTTILDTNITCPVGLQTDYTDRNRLDFIDEGMTEDSLFYIPLNEVDVHPVFVSAIPTVVNYTPWHFATFEDEYFVTNVHNMDDDGRVTVKALNSSITNTVTIPTDGLPRVIQALYKEQIPESCNIYCDHACVKHPNASLGYQCLCSHGYHVVSNQTTKCAPDDQVITQPEMLVYNATHIVGLPGNFIDLQPELLRGVTVVLEAANVRAIDFNLERRMLYYADSQGVQRFSLDGENSVPTTVAEVDGTISGIAVDWISSNVYWTDEDAKTITVSTHDGARHTELVSLADDEFPLDIAVAPQENLLFYSTWKNTDKASISVGVIYRAYLDGTGQTALFTENDMRPTKLTLDYRTRRIYWIDKTNQAIISDSFDGSDFEVNYTYYKASLTSVTLFQSYLYWTDQSVGAIKAKAVNLEYGGTLVRSVSITGNPTHLIMFDESRQPKDISAPCYMNDCSGICLTNSSASYCVAGEGFTTKAPTKTVEGGSDRNPTPDTGEETTTTVASTSPEYGALTTEKAVTSIVSGEPFNGTDTSEYRDMYNVTQTSSQTALFTTNGYTTGLSNTQKTPVIQTDDTETDVATAGATQDAGRSTNSPISNFTTTQVNNVTLDAESEDVNRSSMTTSLSSTATTAQESTGPNTTQQTTLTSGMLTTTSESQSTLTADGSLSSEVMNENDTTITTGQSETNGTLPIATSSLTPIRPTLSVPRPTPLKTPDSKTSDPTYVTTLELRTENATSSTKVRSTMATTNSSTVTETAEATVISTVEKTTAQPTTILSTTPATSKVSTTAPPTSGMTQPQTIPQQQTATQTTLPATSNETKMAPSTSGMTLTQPVTTRFQTSTTIEGTTVISTSVPRSTRLPVTTENRLTTKDTEPPFVENCDSVFTIETTSIPVAVVPSAGPRFIDSVDGVVNSNANPSQLDRWGLSEIIFQGCDSSGNCAMCNTSANVIVPRCRDLQPPENGGLECNVEDNNVGSRNVCSVVCFEGYGQPIGLQQEWSCYTDSGDGLWTPGRVMPPCQELTPLKAVFTASFPFLGPAFDNIEGANSFREVFTNNLVDALSACRGHECTVTFDNRGARRRRAVTETWTRIFRRDTASVSLNFTLEAQINDTTSLNTTDELSAFNSLKDGLQSSLEDVLASPSSLDIEVDGHSYTLDAQNVAVTEVVLACSAGEISLGDGSCASCPRGTRTDLQANSCSLCPEDTYQSESSQLDCQPCPTGHTTIGAGSDDESLCLEICGPGSQSFYGFQPCSLCPVGYFKPNTSSEWCSPCSDDLTTRSEGATSEDSCRHLGSSTQNNRLAVIYFVTAVSLGVIGIIILIIIVAILALRKRRWRTPKPPPDEDANPLQNQLILEEVMDMKTTYLQRSAESGVGRNGHYYDTINSIDDVLSTELTGNGQVRQVRFREAPSIISSGTVDAIFKPIHSPIDEGKDETGSDSASVVEHDTTDDTFIPDGLQEGFRHEQRNTRPRYPTEFHPIKNRELHDIGERPLLRNEDTPETEEEEIPGESDELDPNQIPSFNTVLEKVIAARHEQYSYANSYPPVDYDDTYLDAVLSNPYTEDDPNLGDMTNADDHTPWTGNFQLRTPTPENVLQSQDQHNEYQFGRDLLHEMQLAYTGDNEATDNIIIV